VHAPYFPKGTNVSTQDKGWPAGALRSDVEMINEANRRKWLDTMRTLGRKAA